MNSLTKSERRRIANTVTAAERSTTAEIKVVVKQYGWRDIRDQAERIFRELGLHETKNRNAVMILVVLANQEFLIFGDQKAHKNVPDQLWEDICDEMRNDFSRGEFCLAICNGVREVGRHLVAAFPSNGKTVNQFSDQVDDDS